MKTWFRIIVWTSVFTIVFVASTTAQTLQSRLLPDRTYAVMIKNALSGFDGFKEVIPVTSTQRIVIETGSKAGTAVPCTITIYSTVQDSRKNAETEQWKFTFLANDDGKITDVKTVSALEQLDEKIALSILSRQLGTVLFQTGYALQRRGGEDVTIQSQTPRDGAEDFVDISYKIERHEVEEKMRAHDAPMATEDSGTAVFHMGEQFFLERTFREINRIYIAEDALGEEKNVMMQKDVRVEAVISPH